MHFVCFVGLLLLLMGNSLGFALKMGTPSVNSAPIVECVEGLYIADTVNRCGYWQCCPNDIVQWMWCAPGTTVSSAFTTASKGDHNPCSVFGPVDRKYCIKSGTVTTAATRPTLTSTTPLSTAVPTTATSCPPDYCKNGRCLEAASTGSFRCLCNVGYTGERCDRDVDECRTGKHSCHVNARCINQPGFYFCLCNAGFQGNGFQCTDINECEDGNRCASGAICSNLPGSYTCACPSGFTGDGFNFCSDVNECSTGGHDCHSNALCSNTQGSYSCTCRSGYVGDGFNCQQTSSDPCNPNPCTHGTCTETQGGYFCTCEPGWTGNNCNQDINECATGTAQCHSQADCVDTLGSYGCICRPGYTGDGKNCQDKNECTSGESQCDRNANCVNTDGSYTCACKPGYFGDGRMCLDLNECSTGLHDCSLDATCENTKGSYVCTCKNGFTGDGRFCTVNVIPDCPWTDSFIYTRHVKLRDYNDYRIQAFHISANFTIADCERVCRESECGRREGGLCYDPACRSVDVNIGRNEIYSKCHISSQDQFSQPENMEQMNPADNYTYMQRLQDCSNAPSCRCYTGGLQAGGGTGK
ncbi:fibulin-1 [Lingula anatina]|uniref:Fibulin-1 n=1 Tax=Lingula anatina TaxID=7574 RepID=A0A1S3J8J6_LINAN|nr:fibulin-1 [Lingula anatina]|eukprot:XP_013406727.1 fibulin-1 [Lingula anatina]